MSCLSKHCKCYSSPHRRGNFIKCLMLQCGLTSIIDIMQCLAKKEALSVGLKVWKLGSSLPTFYNNTWKQSLFPGLASVALL